MLKKDTRKAFWILWGAVIILGLNAISDCSRATKLETTIKGLKTDMELMLRADCAYMGEGDFEIHASDHENN